MLLVITWLVHHVQSAQYPYSLRSPFTCESKNLVYLLNCKKCNDVQYVGETGQRIKDRVTGHRCDINKKNPTLVSKHFNSDGHSVMDLECIPIEKIRSNNIEIRKKREKYWRYQLKTHFPDGLNVWDSI